ncbi:hypothetical protein [Selenomonas sputigena]|uniref:hypothetical protein n=1 Tax=Selenomonas sputigena TaxID=69823 RepID=UPI00145ED90F|nr:hypothetical protein [Selenomonas sputigena]
MNDLAVANNIDFPQTLQNGLRQELGLEARIYTNYKEACAQNSCTGFFQHLEKALLRRSIRGA